MMDDDLDDIIDILNKNTDKPPLPKPKELITIKEEKGITVRKYESNMDATCHSGGDGLAGGSRLIEETKESTGKKNARRRSAVNVQSSATKQKDQAPSQDEEQPEENKGHST